MAASRAISVARNNAGRFDTRCASPGPAAFDIGGRLKPVPLPAIPNGGARMSKRDGLDVEPKLTGCGSLREPVLPWSETGVRAMGGPEFVLSEDKVESWCTNAGTGGDPLDGLRGRAAE
jgi:hypothetical protein